MIEIEDVMIVMRALLFIFICLAVPGFCIGSCFYFMDQSLEKDQAAQIKHCNDIGGTVIEGNVGVLCEHKKDSK